MCNKRFLKILLNNIFIPLKYFIYFILVTSLYSMVAFSLALWVSNGVQNGTYVICGISFFIIEVFLTIAFFATKEEYDENN